MWQEPPSKYSSSWQRNSHCLLPEWPTHTPVNNLLGISHGSNIDAAAVSSIFKGNNYFIKQLKIYNILILYIGFAKQIIELEVIVIAW